MKSTLSLLSIILLVFAFSACQKIKQNPVVTEASITDLTIAANFDWKSSQVIQIKIFTKDINNNPLEKVIVKAYTDLPTEGGLLMVTGITDANGYFETNWTLPSAMTEIVLATEHIGLIDYTKVTITAGIAAYTFGGTIAPLKSLESVVAKAAMANIAFLGTYDSQGKPNYLVSPNDVIDGNFSRDITNTLPEGSWVSNHHPDYLSDTYEHDLLLQCQSDVWVTFVHEGAGFKNILGFYTYDLNSPPSTTNDIGTITVIFPNASYNGSGGRLQTGNKVHIGNFPANTGIGWVLFADGWTGEVTEGRHTFYSNKDFNPEPNENIRQHSVLLNDPGRDLILLGFEDLMRDNTSIYRCDHDFNDCIFYIKTNPVPCTILDMPIVDYNAPDSDNDGVPNSFDDYPNDADLAFNNHYPCEVTYGALAYEDLYPGRGDYDFNDLVMDYYFNQITNGENKIKKLEAQFVVRAQGATLHNGFAFRLPIAPSAVESVSGQNIEHSYISLNANNTEANQSEAVIIVFDDTYDILPHPGGNSIGVNTEESATFVDPQNVDLLIEFTNPIAYSVLGSPPYDPFLIVDQTRGLEVHLPDYAPTDLFDDSYFGTEHDNSNPATGMYFKTEENLPWAIHILRSFDYPIEKVQIINAHLKFAEWAESGGALFPDWYEDNVGYRTEANIYDVPE